MSWSPPRGLDAPRVPIVERAFQLAAGGSCRTLEDMIRKLETEGYREVRRHLEGRAIKAKLRRLREGAFAADAASG